MRDYHFGVFIGRFQPLHVGHQHVIEQALERVETLIIFIGSADRPSTITNPFTFQQRLDMIENVYRHEVATGRIMVLPANDVPSDYAWAQQVKERVKVAVDVAQKHVIPLKGVRDYKIALTGFGKDASSFYLDMFPEWDSIQIETQHGTINATDIRADFFRKLPHLPYGGGVLHEATFVWLREFAYTEDFRRLVAEKLAYERDREAYGAGPFLTADALVTHRGKVLLVTRGKDIGKGLLAMPGGFVNADERVFDAAVRELEEETTINLGSLADYVSGHMLADNPKRSLRGRVVSTVFHFDLPSQVEVSKPEGADDAAHADWYEIGDLDRSMFFEDHYDLINELLS